MDRVKLPDEAIEGFRSILEANDSLQFAMGDYLTELVTEFEHVMTRAEVIRQLSSSTGADPATLRDRQTMSAFWTADLRQAYAPLSYHQLRACGRNPEYSFACAEWALAHLPAPVSLIWAYRRGNGQLDPAWVGRWERVRALCDSLAGDSEAPAWVRALCEGILSAGKAEG